VLNRIKALILQAILGGEVEVPTLSGKTQLKVSEDLFSM